MHGNTVKERITYNLPQEVQTIATRYSLDHIMLTSGSCNMYQSVIHREIIDILHAVERSNIPKAEQHHIVTHASQALEANHQGKLVQATRLTDYCWAAVAYCTAGSTGTAILDCTKTVMQANGRMLITAPFAQASVSGAAISLIGRGIISYFSHSPLIAEEYRRRPISLQDIQNDVNAQIKAYKDNIQWAIGTVNQGVEKLKSMFDPLVITCSTAAVELPTLTYRGSSINTQPLPEGVSLPDATPKTIPCADVNQPIVVSLPGLPEVEIQVIPCNYSQNNELPSLSEQQITQGQPPHKPDIAREVPQSIIPAAAAELGEGSRTTPLGHPPSSDSSVTQGFAGQATTTTTASTASKVAQTGETIKTVSSLEALSEKYSQLTQYADKYGKPNVAEALQVLKINEARIAKNANIFETIEQASKDLEKINSDPRWIEFKKDYAKRGLVDLGSIEEAIAGIACKEQGLLTELIRSKNFAEEFIEHLHPQKL